MDCAIERDRFALSPSKTLRATSVVFFKLEDISSGYYVMAATKI